MELTAIWLKYAIFKKSKQSEKKKNNFFILIFWFFSASIGEKPIVF